MSSCNLDFQPLTTWDPRLIHHHLPSSLLQWTTVAGRPLLGLARRVTFPSPGSVAVCIDQSANIHMRQSLQALYQAAIVQHVQATPAVQAA